jgi:hypothetical protein
MRPARCGIHLEDLPLISSILGGGVVMKIAFMYIESMVRSKSQYIPAQSFRAAISFNKR